MVALLLIDEVFGIAAVGLVRVILRARPFLVSALQSWSKIKFPRE